MTCFSIQKYFLFLLLLTSFAGGFAAIAVAASDQTQPPAEEIAKIEAQEEAEKREKSGLVDAPIVVELYTTSNCSACIFADRMLYDAMKDKSVIALSCHIEDFNDASMTPKDKSQDDESAAYQGGNGSSQGPMDPCVFRQWAFSRNVMSDEVSVNIPTFFFNGSEKADGSDLKYFNALLRSYHLKGKNKVLEVLMRWKDKDTISLHLPQSDAKYKPNASVWLVRYKDMGVERVDEGINQGRVLRFSNIVQSIEHVGKWHGDLRTIDVDVTPPEGGKQRGGFVVLVSPLMGAEYMAAGRLDDYPVAADLKAAAEKKARAKAAAENKLKVVPTEKNQKTQNP